MGHTFFAGSLMPARSHRAAAAIPFSLGVHAAVVGGLLAVPLLGGADSPPVVTARPPICTFPIVLPPPMQAAPQPTPMRTAPRPATRPGPVVNAPAALPVPLTSDLPAPGAIAEDVSACVGCALSTGAGSRGGDPGVDHGAPAGTPPGTGTDGAPVRVGGLISPPIKVRNVDPAYPELAKRAGVQGIVIVECVIDRDGRVARTRVLRSIPLLDAAALAAVEQWRYRPTLLNGVPVQVLMTVTVQFNLR